MRRIAILMILVFVLSMIAVPMVMAQAKPAPAKPAPAKAAPAASKEPIKIGAIYDFAGPCYMYSESAINGIKIAMMRSMAKGVFWGENSI
jgi:hypothetical protein